jgi:PAS domain S-box-containing protein
MTLGLRGRFVAFVSAVVIALGVVMTSLAVRVQNERLRHELVERGKLLTSVVAANAADPMAKLEVRDLRRLLAETHAQENVLEAIAFDEDGRVFTDGTIENPSRHQKIDEVEQRHAAVSDALLVDYTRNVMTVTKPVRVGGEHIGGVRLRYSLAGLVRDQAILARRTAVVGAVFALLGVLAVAFLTEAVTRPLREVIEATRALAGGERVAPLRVRTVDEVGELAASFNEMMRKLRETTVSRDDLDRILTTMGECLIVAGPDGEILRVNRVGCDLVGAAEEELVGRSIHDILRAPTGFQSLLHTLNADGSARGLETQLIAGNGDAVPVLVSVSAMAPAPDSQQSYVIVAADLSERLRIEQQKDEFVTMVHHEVRAPLTAVRGAIGLLEGGVAGELGERSRDLVDIAMRNSERMERLVNDLLATRKLESGHMEFQLENVELIPLVEQSIRATSAWGDKFGVRFVFTEKSGDGCVRVDPDRLIQVLTNVLSNAVRFSPEGDEVGVSVIRHQGLLRVSVADRGPGIPVDFQKKVFDKFTRADPPDWRHRSGTGLGMSISKAIMDELDGAISFATQIDNGTTFFVDLPEVG